MKLTQGTKIIITRDGSVYRGRRGVIQSRDFNSTAGWWYLMLEDESRPLSFCENDFMPYVELEPQPQPSISPYHTVHIPKGVFGEASKIIEELEEFKDADLQGNPILGLCELADVVGAIEGYVAKQYNLTLQDVINMMELNKKAFQNGHRS